MPTSFHSHLAKMVDWIFVIQPRTVLDVGVGHGKWGFLAREYTDIFFNRYERKDWLVTIDGVEAFPQYETPTYHYAYNKVYFGNIIDVLPTLPDYDLVIVGDVIEHFPKEQGQALLQALRKKAAFILLSSPTRFFQQEILGNDFETHHSLWSWRDFQDYQFDYEEIDQALFVTLLRGDLPPIADVTLTGKAASAIYGLPWIKSRPKLAQIAKKYIGKLPRYKPLVISSAVQTK